MSFKKDWVEEKLSVFVVAWNEREMELGDDKHKAPLSGMDTILLARCLALSIENCRRPIFCLF